ncbi:unnamed protein product [Urochloa humidicola]
MSSTLSGGLCSLLGGGDSEEGYGVWRYCFHQEQRNWIMRKRRYQREKSMVELLLICVLERVAAACLRWRKEEMIYFIENRVALAAL